MRFLDLDILHQLRKLHGHYARKRRALLVDVKTKDQPAEIAMIKKERAKEYKYFCNALRYVANDSYEFTPFIDSFNESIDYSSFFKVNYAIYNKKTYYEKLLKHAEEERDFFLLEPVSLTVKAALDEEVDRLESICAMLNELYELK